MPELLKERRNEPSVEGAYTRSNERRIPPCRSRRISSIESAPATMPATKEETFAPAFAPLSVGTVRCVSARCVRPARSARRITGTRPALDTRFASSNAADSVAVWLNCIWCTSWLGSNCGVVTTILPDQRHFPYLNGSFPARPSVNPGLGGGHWLPKGSRWATPVSRALFFRKCGH